MFPAYLSHLPSNFNLKSLVCLLPMRVLVCLPFTRTYHSVHGLGKWKPKFSASRCRSGIAFTICTNQFHWLKNGRENLKLVWRVALKKRHTDRKNRKTFSDIPVDPLLLQSFHWNVPKSCQVFCFPVISNCIFVNGKQPCSPSWWLRTKSMTSCKGSIVHLPRLLDLLHCCSLLMWAQRWIYRARRIQWSTQVSS